MVLVRTLLSTPTSLALPSTRQLLSHRLTSPNAVKFLHLPEVGWNSPISSSISSGLNSNSGLKSLSDGLRKAHILTPRVFTIPICERSRQCGGWLEKTQARIQCLKSTLSSSRKELSIEFSLILEEKTTIDAETQSALDELEMDGRLALKLALEERENLENTDTVELSLLICNDEFIQDLNSKWLGKNAPTDVLSFPQDQPPGLTPYLLLGDVIISVETAGRQAKERGHKLLDELRILLVHGLLHVLGYDHELGQEASDEMEKKEAQFLSRLGWQGKGLINSSLDRNSDDVSESYGGIKSAGLTLDDSVKKSGGISAFKILFCDMDGTLLNTKCQVTQANADALKAAKRKGVQVVIATGKTQYAAMVALQKVGLSGEGGVISTTSPGVFVQGLLVYGQGGVVVHSASLHPDLVREAFNYSMEHNLPSIGFCENRCVTLFQHPKVEELHDVYLEPKAELISSIDDLLASFTVQKIGFFSSPEIMKLKVRPDLALKIQGRATLVQAQDDFLELLPLGQSKGAGVKMLLDHLGVSSHEVMAIGDGENDIEMIQLAGWGVAMANATDETKAVAKALTGSNNEDGVAQAIQRYILS